MSYLFTLKVNTTALILEVSKSIKSMYDDRIEKDMDAVQDMMSYLNL